MTAYSDTQPDTPRNRGDFSAAHLTGVTPAEDFRTIMINRVSWGAVSAGVVMALTIQLVLNLLGVGIGAATIEPGIGATPTVAEFSMGAAIWWTVAGVIAAFIGGYTAGRLAGEPRESTAGWHGLTAWAASVLVIAVLVTAGAGVLLGGTLNNLGVSGIFTTQDTAAGEIPTLTVWDDGTGIDMTGYPPQPGAVDETMGATPTADEQVVTTVDAAAATSRTALFSGIALLLGALAAWFGGRAGAVKPTVTDERLRREPLH